MVVYRYSTLHCIWQIFNHYIVDFGRNGRTLFRGTGCMLYRWKQPPQGNYRVWYVYNLVYYTILYTYPYYISNNDHIVAAAAGWGEGTYDVCIRTQPPATPKFGGATYLLAYLLTEAPATRRKIRWIGRPWVGGRGLHVGLHSLYVCGHV
jgi:hypothetical protein